MEPEELDKEQIKLILRVLETQAANLENWSYVSANAEYLDKKRVADALDQMLTTFKPLIQTMQGMVEIEALTKLDPYDLI